MVVKIDCQQHAEIVDRCRQRHLLRTNMHQRTIHDCLTLSGSFANTPKTMEVYLTLPLKK